MRKFRFAGLCVILAGAFTGCQRKATQALQVETSHISLEVGDLQEQIESAKGNISGLEDQIQEQAEGTKQLLEHAGAQVAKIDSLEAEVVALKSTASSMTGALAVEKSDTADLKSSMNDILGILRAQKLANERELRALEERRRRAEIAAAPIKQRIQQLANRRDVCAARLAEITGLLNLRYSDPSDSIYTQGKAAMGLLAERDRAVAPEVRQLKVTIAELDGAIQSAAAELTALEVDPAGR